MVAVLFKRRMTGRPCAPKLGLTMRATHPSLQMQAPLALALTVHLPRLAV